MIASIRIINVEKIPLSLCCIGGLALVLNFVECPIDCALCPWEANLSAKSAKIVALDFSEVDSIVNRYNPDIVFLHGGEPYMKDYARAFLEMLYSRYRGSPYIGMKIGAPYLVNDSVVKMLYNVMKIVDVLLIEFITVQNLKNQLDNVMRTGLLDLDKHIEIALVLNSDNAISSIWDSIDAIESLPRFSIVNFVPYAQIQIKEVEKIMNRLRKLGIYAQMPSSTVVELSSSYCPSCGMPIVVRNRGIVLKRSVNADGLCTYCGNRVVKNFSMLKSKKRFKISIDIPIE